MPVRGRAAQQGRDRPDSRLDQSGRDLAERFPRWQALGLRQAGPAGPAGGQERRLGPQCRSITSSWRGWSAKACTPSPEADRATLIRRLSLDLIGLPPTPAEVDAFVADASPDAYEKAGRSPAGVAAVRRALGAALARPGPLRRLARLPARRPARRSGPIATGSSTPSTPTCRSISSRSSSWPATCCPNATLEQTDRHRLPSLHADQRRGRLRAGGDPRQPGRSTASTRRRPSGSAPRSNAPSATTTSTIRSRRRTTTSSSRSSTTPPIEADRAQPEGARVDPLPRPDDGAERRGDRRRAAASCRLPRSSSQEQLDARRKNSSADLEQWEAALLPSRQSAAQVHVLEVADFDLDGRGAAQGARRRLGAAGRRPAGQGHLHRHGEDDADRHHRASSWRR